MDMIGICETWLKPNTFLPLNEASPPDFNYAHVAQASKQGEGVALISKSIFSLSSNQDIVPEPTHSCGNTLDLIISHGLCVSPERCFHLLCCVGPLSRYI